MGTTTEYRLLDLHCDTVTRCLEEGWNLDHPDLHLSLSRLPKSIKLCQAAAIYIPDKYRGKEAQDYFTRAYHLYRAECTCKQHDLLPLQAFHALPEAQTTFFLTVEGGAALGGDLAWVDKLWELGVRMMTLTWNGANEIAGGAISGGGFTPFGRQVVARMEELGMAVDVSHLSDEGFWQLCEFATAPFCASHSNARALCGHPRNLTDEMLQEIIRRGGVVGINYCRTFLTPEGKGANINAVVRHIHHMLDLGGEDAVALGSDFDGTDLPDDLQGVQDLEPLIQALIQSGLSDKIVGKLLFENAWTYLKGLQK
ncbi:MAG: dipeptidase [Oscillospiraceae bacterium]